MIIGDGNGSTSFEGVSDYRVLGPSGFWRRQEGQHTTANSRSEESAASGHVSSPYSC